jgi:hypothetical protein
MEATTSTKYFQSVFEAQIDKSTVESTREITFVIASEATNKEHRNKFLYNWDKWNLDNFNSNPIVGYQHNVYGDNMCVAPNPDDVIAKATAWADTFKGKRAILSKATFEPAELNATAEKVFRKIIFGSLNACSTGVLPWGGPLQVEHSKNDKGQIVDSFLRFPGQMLAEWSVVNIPADANALRRSLKSHAISGLSNILKYIPELSMNDLRGLKVQEVLDLLEKKSAPNLSEIEQVLSGPDPNLNKYEERLRKLKK